MIINFDEIKAVINNESLKEVSQETGIPYRTLQDWKLGKNNWLVDVEERLTKIQNFFDYKNSDNKNNVNDIANADYIMTFDSLSDYLDDDGNFKTFSNFKWWEKLADSIAYLENTDVNTLDLEVNELQDYIDIAIEHGF